MALYTRVENLLPTTLSLYYNPETILMAVRPMARSVLRITGRLSWIEHLRGSRGNPQLISRKYVLTSAQNVQSMSGCLRIPREFCRTEWCAATGRIEPERRVWRSGRGSAIQSRRFHSGKRSRTAGIASAVPPLRLGVALQRTLHSRELASDTS